MTSKTIDQAGTYYAKGTGNDEVGVYKNSASRVWGEVSLSAIFGGVVIALVSRLMLNLLGLSLAANTINPLTETNPIEPALGTATIIWIAISTLLALFAGGWVAGRLANTTNHLNSILHGLITWALTSIVLLAIVGSAVGGLISGFGTAVSQGTSLLASGLVDTAPAVIQSLGIEGETLVAFTGEFSNLISNKETDASSEAGVDTTQAQSTSPEPMTLADLSLSRAVTDFVTATDITETQAQELALQLSDRTSLSEQEATAQLNSWREAYQDVRLQVEETAREVGQAATDTLAAVAGVLFAALFAGAVAAGWGAYLAVSWHEDVPVHLRVSNKKLVN